jgi:proliferating cell nuclear antigen
MHLKIDNKQKMDIFSSIFQLFKNWGTHINMQYSQKGLYVQLMDKSHICLAELNLLSTWFSEYSIDNDYSISVNGQHFATMMSYALKHDTLEILYAKNSSKKAKTTEMSLDHLYINFVNSKENKNSFDHFFEIPLIETDDEIMGIPPVDYSVELTIEAKKLVELINELLVFGQDLNVICNEDNLQFTSNGDSGQLKVEIPTEELNEYAINEGEIINVSYSLSHLCKMCSSIKLSPNIILGISEEYPMLLKYDLGNSSDLKFYIAPKVSDN